jgi:Tol biopolymer transport system component
MMPKSLIRIASTFTVVLVAFATSSGLADAGITMIRASVDRNGGNSNGSSSDPFVSATGRYVTFASGASDLVLGDNNDLDDVFVRDMLREKTSPASVDTSGGPPNGTSTTPVLSASGRYVAFLSWASDLVLDDTNGLADSFVHDMVSSRTVLVGPGSPADTTDDEEYGPSISGSGRFVAFVSSASLVPEDDNDDLDVYIRNRVGGEITLVSVAGDGSAGNADSISPSVDGDGRHVAFLSTASNLVSGDTNGHDDLFVRDLVQGTTVRASVSTTGGDANAPTLIRPAMSADGKHVVFASHAWNLVPGDTNERVDVFVRHLETATTTRASVDMDDDDANAESMSVSISEDGRYAAFRSNASDLVSGDESGLTDIFVRDLTAGSTTRVSIAVDGGEPNNDTWNPSINYTGRFVAFVSFASNLVPDDTNGLRDVFVRSLA